ncbi:unnamed protein product [Phytomonas sp. Hart1]|nr:unnamed protein product [Phytomonas sp. Hart1]|eukprot:CCW67333.1 unnamed protein product [Phytomonas sp. isolate Hart1]
MFHSKLWFLKKVDVCVIGGGPAGVAAALRATDFGKKACLIEKSRIGGADLWNGALQSKTLWEMANFAHYMKNTQNVFHVKKEMPPIKFHRVSSCLKEAAEKRESQILHQLKASEVDTLFGFCAFETPNTVRVNFLNGETEIVESDHFVIATGAQPRAHPMVVADGKVVFTSDNVMLNPFPKSIVVIGAGIIGCEFATIFAKFSMTQVNLIEKSNRILPMEDDDVSFCVQDMLEKRGVNFHHNSQMIDCKVKNGRFHYLLRDVKNVTEKEHVVDAALISIGRVPCLSNLNLDKIGVKLDGGRIERDKFLRVKPHKHIYACGDAATRVALVNVGELEAQSCVNHMYKPYPEDQLIGGFDNLSTIMFLDQEVAAVGLNELQCQKMNISYKIARYAYKFVGRALAMGSDQGFVKLIVTNDEKMQVLGVRAISPHASSVIELASLAIHNRESAYTLSGLHTAYPSVTQGFKECVNMLLGVSTLKPNVFPELVLKEWNPPNFERGRAYQKQSN